MTFEKNICCVNCRRFVPDGKRNDNGERTGFCEEICGAPTSESNVCHPSVTFRQIKGKDGETRIDASASKRLAAAAAPAAPSSGVEIAVGDFDLPVVVISGDALSTVACALDVIRKYVGRRGNPHERAWFKFLDSELRVKCQSACDAIFDRYLQLRRSKNSSTSK